MIYTHVLKVGGAGVRSPLDALPPLTSEVGQRKSILADHYPCAKAIGAASNGRLRKVLRVRWMAAAARRCLMDPTSAVK